MEVERKGRVKLLKLGSGDDAGDGALSVSVYAVPILRQVLAIKRSVAGTARVVTKEGLELEGLRGLSGTCASVGRAETKRVGGGGRVLGTEGVGCLPTREDSSSACWPSPQPEHGTRKVALAWLASAVCL